MRKNPHYIHNCFPSSFIDYENKESIDSEGNKIISVVAVKRDLADIKSLPIDAYPSLESQLKAGITPDFVNPVINSVNSVDVDNSAVINELLEKHNDVVRLSDVDNTPTPSDN